MLLTYYVEVNLVAIIVAAILMSHAFRRTSRGESSNIIYLISLGLLIAMCVADIVALTSDGRNFWGAHFAVLIGNSLFFAAQAMLAFAWLLFFQIRLKIIRNIVSVKTAIVALPLAVFIALVVANCFTGILFSVDANNVYQREDYIFFHWITELLYVVGCVLQLLVGIIRAKTKHQRRDIAMYLLYFVPTLVAGGWQIFYFGASTFQVGVAISSLLVFLQLQDKQLIRDELTGLNNRRSLRDYEAMLVNSGEEYNLTLFMIDVDSFKQINDTYGHVAGDEALVEISQILKRSLADVHTNNRLIIYRYAGDEFVVAGTDLPLDLINLVKVKIQLELDRVNATKKNPFDLSLSVGFGTGKCKSAKDFEEILQKADDSMYQVKSRKKKKLKAEGKPVR